MRRLHLLAVSPPGAPVGQGFDTSRPALPGTRHPRSPAWSRSPAFLPAVLALAFTVALGAVMSRHEMWRDEIMAWLLARDAATPWQVFSLIKYEGHPGLWYLLIWPLAHLSWNPAWMQALHALIAGAAVFVLLRYGPFSWAVRVVLALGYFLAYEWAVISRNYAVSVLLLFLFCALYGDRWRRFPALALVLFLLCHTNVHSLILVSIFLVVLLVEFPVAYVGQWDDAHRFLGRVILGFFIIAAGLVTAVVQIKPPGDSGTAREWVYEWQPERFQRVASIFCRAYLPLPADRLTFWNGNRLLEAGHAPPPRPWFAVPLERTVPVAACILGVGCLFFLKRPWMVVPYLLGSVALSVFFYVKYFGSLRNHGFLFLLFLVTVWLSTCYRPWHTSRSWIDILPDWWDRHRMKILLVLGLVHVWGTWTAVRQDWREPFSNGRAAGAWIRAVYPDRGQLVFAGDQAAVVSTVVGYSQLDRIFYLDRKEFGAHLKQDRRFGAVARPDVPQRVHDLAAREGKSVLLVLSYRLSAEEMASLGGQFLQAFDAPSVIGESYYLYLYAWKPSAPAATSLIWDRPLALQPEQDVQAVFDRGHRLAADRAPARDQSLDRHGPNAVAQDRRPILDASFRRRDRNVARHAAERRGHGQNDDEARGATVEEIFGDDQNGTAASLLMPARRIEIGKPDLAPTRSAHRRFRLLFWRDRAW